ncbi:MAG: cytochrome b/b6 domain-containing protein [Rhodobacter sp.]|nr:cytochrome b/b6 domain-containing protein [Rhodobacter sp.]
MKPVQETADLPVWDRLVRLFHWSLVVLVALALITGFLGGAESVTLHLVAGTGIAALLIVRLVWGFLGTGFARFSDFLVGPRAVMRHVRALVAGHPERHLGHNPLGGWMIVALIGCGAVLVASGAMVLGGVLKAGPLNQLTYDTGTTGRAFHKIIAFVLLGLVVLHVAGAIFESWRSQENLVRAMITGRKQRRNAQQPAALVAARPWPAAAAVTLLLAGAGAATVALASRPVPLAPATVAGTAYAAQCSECHIAFNPSLLPRASWTRIMATLDSHFGEDATIGQDQVAVVTAWLSDHSAETADTKPAHVFRRVDPANPTRITATPFWIRTHRDIPASVFAAAPVFARTNCAACHSDAGQGWFYPGNVDLAE